MTKFDSRFEFLTESFEGQFEVAVSAGFDTVIDLFNREQEHTERWAHLYTVTTAEEEQYKNWLHDRRIRYVNRNRDNNLISKNPIVCRSKQENELVLGLRYRSYLHRLEGHTWNITNEVDSDPEDDAYIMKFHISDEAELVKMFLLVT